MNRGGGEDNFYGSPPNRFQPLFQPKGVGYYEPSPQPSSYLRQEDPYQNMSDDMYSIPMMDRSNPTMELYPLEGDDYPPRGPFLGSSFHQGSEGDYGLQPPERIQVEHLKVPEKYMGLIVGKGGQNLEMIRTSIGVGTKVNRKTDKAGISELVISGTRDRLEGCKQHIIWLFTERKVPHEEITKDWPTADKEEANSHQQHNSSTTGGNQTGRHTNNSGPGPANNADEDDDDEIMVYEQPDDATPVRLNESRHFQQRGRRSTGSGDRNDQRQSRSRSGGRAAEGSFVGEKENMSKEDQAYGSDVQETCRIQETTIRDLRRRLEFCELRNERLNRQILSNMSSAEEIVFLKLELEEKGKVAESYRVDNYKLLQRLDATVSRMESLESENDTLRQLLRRRTGTAPGET